MQEEKKVQSAFNELLAHYMSSNHRQKSEVIEKAFNFALKATEGVRRPSGEHYMLHSISVATIVSKEMGLGSTSISAALLHDIIEESDYTIEDIKNIFGSKIAQLVEGLSKISGGIFGDKALQQAEKFKNLLLTMSEDIRVILIKICDRLDNMRNLNKQSPIKQEKIAGETLYIYAPLANRLGLNKIKTELEDLAFKYEHPEEYAAIESKLAYTRQKHEMLFEEFTTPIKQVLDAIGVNYSIKARMKTPYSIWNKMQNKHVSYDEIYDILAVRVIFNPRNEEDDIKECFNIYVELCKLYPSHPDRLRDWLSQPKANGYQALHVTLMSKGGRWIEVQIRSKRMDDIAEKGFAAHWRYKTGAGPLQGEKNVDQELNGWLATIKEILDNPKPDSMDFLDDIKLNLFASEIFVFSPKGEVITMPAGGTVLDYAFQIHTHLGIHCYGAKVNHKLVPLSHKLKSGDQVEIITSNNTHVQPTWVNFVSTAKARNKIHAFINKQEREEAKVGTEILTTWLEKHALTLTTSILNKLTERHNAKDYNKVLVAIARNEITLDDEDLNAILLQSGKKKSIPTKGRSWKNLLPFVKSKIRSNKESQSVVVSKDFDCNKTIVISDENISQYTICECCHPIPGDAIYAYINNERKIEVHTKACQEMAKHKATFASSLLSAEWQIKGEMVFYTNITLKGIDRKGILKDVTMILSDSFDISINNLNVFTRDGIFNASMILEVKSNKELERVIKKLSTVGGMQHVYRS